MALFVASYDLHKHRDYTRVINALETSGGERVLESLWLIALNNTAIEVRDWLKQFVDNDDSLAVIELKVGSMWGTVRGRPEGVAWLKANL